MSPYRTKRAVHCAVIDVPETADGFKHLFSLASCKLLVNSMLQKWLELSSEILTNHRRVVRKLRIAPSPGGSRQLFFPSGHLEVLVAFCVLPT